ncbi:RsmB/NOP family class I SAM-dependent RNA methyltransferase [Candidatus Woesearchaeota archaeon]|nr:RsmB/NOP family class I SAM-dependent RNA methyltransferase [Candidatus Woesearchaeota archaeon]
MAGNDQERVLDKDFEKLLKPGFIARYKELLGVEGFQKFLTVSKQWLRKSVRVNTLKASVDEVFETLSKDWVLKPIPWCKEGFFIEHKTSERFDIGNTVEHQLGYIYVQEASSMIPALDLDVKPEHVVLDACAAPGSKTTQLAALMRNQGLIIANDSDFKRLKALSMNLQRCGVSNAVITNNDARVFSKLENFFDRVLLDAPCSGTGTISKSLKTLQIWNPNMVKKLAGQQKALLAAGFKALKPNGVLVYSTCTLEPEEDEGVVSWLLDNFDNAKVLPIKLNVKHSKPVMSFNGLTFNSQVKHCLRIWPQDNNTSGFFVAKIVKKE